MPNEIKMVIEGHVGKDPRIGQTGGGKSVVNFSVAAKIGKGDDVKSIWVDVSDWADSKWRQSDYFKKGDAVRVEGTPGAKLWKTSEGESRVSLTLNAFKAYKIAWRKNEEGPAPDMNQPENGPGMTEHGNVVDNDLPF